MNKCTECGHCCVIFNYVAMSKFEAEMRGLKVEEMSKIFPDPEGGQRKRGGMLRLKRKRVFWGAIGKWVYICEYFDIDTRLCSVYYNRPNICRKYDCERDQRGRAEWEKLFRGEHAQCLST